MLLRPGQASFRRILLSKILLLSIPVLLAGEYTAYRKARSSFLTTARENLISSAVRKGGNLDELIATYRANMVTAREAFSLQIQSGGTTTDFIPRMTRWFPPGVQCIQLVNLTTKAIEANSCEQRTPPCPSNDPTCKRTNPSLIPITLNYSVPKQSQSLQDPLSTIDITPVALAQQSAITSPPAPNTVSLFVAPPQQSNSASQLRQLSLIFSAPIYDAMGQARYLLSVQAAVDRGEASPPGSLSGETIIVAVDPTNPQHDGTILAHPKTDYIGRKIDNEMNAPIWRQIITNASAGQQDTTYLMSMGEPGTEWLAGYSAIETPTTAGKTQTWVVLAVAPVENALRGLKDIQQVLVVLTLCLIGASLVATFFLTRDLSRPIEQLGQYALHIHEEQTRDRRPHDFRIREINQLAAALDSMVAQLEERAAELETAWQEAEVANQLKSEFLANTSHELRTPLNAIIGSVRLVRDDCCDNRQEELEFLQQADEAAVHLLRIIDDLLSISRIEAGRFELHLQPVHIQELCGQCIRMVEPGANSKQIKLSSSLDSELAKFLIILDKQRIQQGIINLLSNATKFTPKDGSVSLSAYIGTGEQLLKENRPDNSPVNPETIYLCLEVTDTGIGIPKEKWNLLFRPFQQLDSSYTRRYEGTGLGLALTKRFAELHGGTVSFTSVPNEGSTFRIWLPLTGPDAHSERIETEGSTGTDEQGTANSEL